MVDRGCWRPRTVHSGVTSDMIGRTEKIRCTLLWCYCSLPLAGVPVSKPVMLCIRHKTRWRRSQQRRSGCMVLLDSFLSLLGLCRVLSVLRVRAWQVVMSLATEGTCSKLEVEHHPARATVTGVKLVSVKVLPWRTAPGSEGVGMIDNRHLLPVAHCQERCVGDLCSLPKSPHGRNDGRHQHGSFRENMLQLSNELPPHALRNHGELARVDPDVDHHAPDLSVPGDVGQPVVDVVDG